MVPIYDPMTLGILLASLLCVHGAYDQSNGAIEQSRETSFPDSNTPTTHCSVPLDHPVPFSVADKGSSLEWTLEGVTRSIPSMTSKSNFINVGQIKFRQTGCNPACPWFKSYNTGLANDGIAQLTWGSITYGHLYEACVENTQAAFLLRINVRYQQKT